MDDVEARVELWREQVESEPDNELSRFSLAQAYYQAKAWGEALQQYEAALRLKPEWMVPMIQRGQCLVRLGRLDEAKEALRQGRALAVAQGHEEPQQEIDEILADLE